MIPQRNISLIANRLAKGRERRIPEAVIERDYCLAWFLVGLAAHPIRDRLAFKGGTALRRCWFEDYRFSEDLDFTLTGEISFPELRAALDEIFSSVEAQCGLKLTFDREDRHSHQNCHTFYMGYQGPLPAPNDVKVDITIRERLCFPLAERPVLRTYEGFEDLREDAAIRVYALEEIAVEKLVALSDRARNEPRDLYDFWFLLDRADIRLAELRQEIEDKLAFRGREIDGIEQAVNHKEQRLQRLWEARLALQVNELPPFESVFRSVRRALRQADFP